MAFALSEDPTPEWDSGLLTLLSLLHWQGYLICATVPWDKEHGWEQESPTRNQLGTSAEHGCGWETPPQAGSSAFSFGMALKDTLTFLENLSRLSSTKTALRRSESEHLC